MKHPRRLRKTELRLAALVAALGTIASRGVIPHDAWAGLTPAEADKEVLRISKLLRPVDDSHWKEIAGTHITERYQIAPGDTLSDISKRLFGDARYWPKIWALNNDSITNPHLIRKGNAIAFLPGSGTELPRVAIEDGPSIVTAPSIDAYQILPPEKHAASTNDDSEQEDEGRSKEWQKLPTQRWEKTYDLPQSKVVYKDYEIDSRSKVSVSEIKFDLPAIATSERLEPVGKIIGSTSPATYLTQNDRIYIRSDQVRIGEIYDLTSEPVFFPFPGSTADGTYSYPMEARVKIIGEKDGIFLGRILSAQAIATRDSFLIPAHERIRILDPVPGSSELEARILLDHRSSTYAVAQFKEVFLDRGSVDGVTPGMIFRSYQTRDAVMGTDFGRSDLVLQAEVMVVQTSRNLSAAIVTQSQMPVEEGMMVRLEIQGSAIQNVPALHENSPEEKLDDELEKLDTPDHLTGDEKRELRQLENWKNNPTPAPSPSSVPAPEPTPSPTPEFYVSPEPSASPEPVISPEPSISPEPAITPEPTPSPETTPSPEPAPPAQPEELPPPTAPVEETPPPPPPPSTSAPSATEGTDSGSSEESQALDNLLNE